MLEKCLPKVKTEALSAEWFQDDCSRKAAYLRKAKEDYTRANLLIKWRKKEVDVQTASVKKAKLAVELAEAERNVARVSKLIEQNVASAQKYNFSDFEATVAKKKNKEYQKSLSTETKEIAKAKKLKAGYEKISKQ